MVSQGQTTNQPRINVEKITPMGNTLICGFSYDAALEPYFNSGLIYVNYDFPLERIPSSVLSIPVMGLLVPVAWAVGATVVAEAVDGRFVESLRRVEGIMKQMYPRMKTSAEVQCSPIDTPWPQDGERDCLLYSGGIDSTASAIRHLGPNLTLASIRGAPDLRLWEGEFWERAERSLKPFVESIGVDRHVIETNALDVVNFEGLNLALKGTFDHGWWENLSHGLILLSFCAPFTFVGGVKRMMIASSNYQLDNEPWGSTPASDQSIAWGPVSTVHDSYDLSRLRKIKEILAPYMAQHPGTVPLRVCTGRRERRLASGTLNCGLCPKCVRSSLGLLWAGVDPASCGFPPPDFATIKGGLISGRFRTAVAYTLRTIQASRNPPTEELSAIYPTYADFLNWFYDWEFPKGTGRKGTLTRLAPKGSRRRRLLDRVRH